ncbi:tRNA uridine-5-carboxymethylaminomethyl(34) synthesis GTPase MnmE [Elusimicrobiota bacterium]
MRHPSSTIISTATPPGKSALSVIRMSGADTIAIIGKVFRSSKNIVPAAFEGFRTYHGHIYDGTIIIDEVLIHFYKAPNSYSGEDMLEISCHGNVLIVEKILELLIRKGCSLAEPGEFTKRAFINGKIDLSQAEAVESLINSKSERAIEESLKMIRGDLKKKICHLKDEIANMKARIDAQIEFEDTDGIKGPRNQEIVERFKTISDSINGILTGNCNREKLNEGQKISICGRPNVGKSSLYNLILNRSRSIVSGIPGTTRNVIDSELVFEGYLVKLYDTAGSGVDSDCLIDIESAEKSSMIINESDIIICVFDISEKIKQIDKEIVEKCKGKKIIAVLNKSDLTHKIENKNIEVIADFQRIIEISCIKETGLEDLRDAIGNQLKFTDNNSVMVSARQQLALREINDSINEIVESLEKSSNIEIISYLIDRVLESAGKLDGTTIEKDMLERIFSSFCIGK